MNCTKGNVVTKTILLISEGYFNRCNLFTPFYFFPVDVANSNLWIKYTVSMFVDRLLLLF